MAVHSPIVAYNFALEMVHKSPLSDVKIQILDDAAGQLWMAAPWRWTVGSMTAVTLAANTADYTITPPADILYVISAYITNGIVRDPLHVDPILPPVANFKGPPKRMSVVSTTLRITPALPSLTSGETWYLVPTYKKTRTIVTESNDDTVTTLGLPDEWFWVYNQLVLHHAYKYANDRRAGEVQYQHDGKIVYTGQLAQAMAAIEIMKRAEKLPAAESTIQQEERDA